MVQRLEANLCKDTGVFGRATHAIYRRKFMHEIKLLFFLFVATNMLVTSILSQLASYPQPLLRAVLVHPDICLQPSVRGLFTAIGKVIF